MDASAVVAMLAFEPGFEELVAKADEGGALISSGLARWEAVRALTKYLRDDSQRAERDIDVLFSRYNVSIVAIGEHEGALAIEAHREYGKGNHPAQLNMGDCFAYACAKANGARLLYKGEDFARTDLA